ncbi:MAG: phosphoribosylformylglycinamidine synthase I [Acidimicrobiia bacterium]
MSRPRIAVVIAPGSNRDGEAARAVQLAGGDAEIVPIGSPLDRFAGLILPGGFSYGDALGAGMRWALEVGDELRAFAERGRAVLGICNGFQVLVRAGLLPGDPGDGDGAAAGGAAPEARSVTLTDNAAGRFTCRWVALAPEAGARAGLADALPPVIACPVAHGEGRLAVRDEATLARLEAGGHVLFRYVEGTNPNGSVADIAGLCDATGLVWGLMPHPEDHVIDLQNPFPDRPGRLGLALFEAFVNRARSI